MPDPINPHATPEASALLRTLYRLQGKTTLSAQHDYISSGSRYFDEITALTGRAPSIFGSDFSFVFTGEKPADIQHCGPANLSEPGHGRTWEYGERKVFAPQGEVQVRDIDLHRERLALVDRCIAQHQQGRIITLMWHGPTPDRGDLATDGNPWDFGAFPGEKWRQIFEPGRVLHAQWQAQVDRIAGYLKLLQDAHVPVLWRPYHEMNGIWFWWGNRRDKDGGFARLWRMLYERLVHHHGLHNLLWVWNPNAPREIPGDEAYPTIDFFPGADWVDVLAADVYHNDYRQSHHDELVTLGGGKLIALGEVGHLPTPDILREQPQWSWVMPWGGLVFRFNRREAIQEVYRHLD